MIQFQRPTAIQENKSSKLNLHARINATCHSTNSTLLCLYFNNFNPDASRFKIVLNFPTAPGDGSFFAPYTQRDEIWHLLDLKAACYLLHTGFWEKNGAKY
jgi:hypothetical protein